MREIGLKYGSLSGKIVSPKKKDIVYFESSLERDLIYLLDFDNEVLEYLEQPLTIEYQHNGRKRRYTPDFLVTYHRPNGRKLLVEVKYSYDLEKDKVKSEPKFAAARNFCKDNGLEFVIMTEEQIRGKDAYLENVKFLMNYKHALEKCPKAIDTFEVDRFLNLLEYYGPMTINNILDEYTKNENNRAEMIFWTWHFIATNEISCDLKQPLTMESTIWLNSR